MDANLIITYDPTHEGKAKQEVENLFGKFKSKPSFLKSDTLGIFLVNTAKPKELAKKLREFCMKEPDKFEATSHYVPIDKWCESKIKDMQLVIKGLVPGIKQEDKWKLNLEKRKFEGDSRDLIMKLTEPVDRPKVDLKNPDKIIQVEIIGDKAGISLLKNDELLEVGKIKS